MTTYNVLFLCTGNSARSIMAEALLNYWGKGRFNAFSAGSHPQGHVHELALETLERNRLAVTGLRSKSWSDFAASGAPRLNFVFTVCDRAAEESCPVWPGQPMTAHWGIQDPAAVAGLKKSAGGRLPAPSASSMPASSCLRACESTRSMNCRCSDSSMRLGKPRIRWVGRDDRAADTTRKTRATIAR